MDLWMDSLLVLLVFLFVFGVRFGSGLGWSVAPLVFVVEIGSGVDGLVIM